jgi:hypothetical protein
MQRLGSITSIGMTMTLADASLLQLVLELMKGGKAGVIPELAALEPIEIDAIVEVLSARSGTSFGHDTDAWCRWFVEECDTVSEEDKKILALAKQMDETTRYYVGRLTKKRGGNLSNKSDD